MVGTSSSNAVCVVAALRESSGPDTATDHTASARPVFGGVLSIAFNSGS